MQEREQLPFRLAMRAEGAHWNAYVAKPDTMEGAIWIGSISMGLVAHNERRKKAFLELMTLAMADLVEDILGRRPTWQKPIDAPEHERSKE
jgi:hypothetical protein